MNKSVKNKKYLKLNIKRNFTKQDLLFLKKYPELFPMCTIFGITKRKIDYIFKVITYTMHKPGKAYSEIELGIRMIIAAYIHGHSFPKNSIGVYYQKLFEKAGIKMQDIFK
ncbi:MULTISPECIES: hypothetical protein [Clostridium]|uniref:Uncharacterized protein n=1 Tax=Clostridium coskatii TaxID=1705578 RepID=A0A162LJ32_9CLOT|nr:MULTISPECIES: hypothetical protein [Clostridium]OAA94096.1 hypothetical protein WX73_03666 [Clostridium coskatii]OBR96658.1 hypothetical protein CLCOS_08200 [Clostridium coskatii]QXE20438.1 hypothetical protein B5S50_17215 [Clostridium sp. 001]